MFRELGATVINADEATHAVYAPGTPGFDAVVEEFGRQFVRDREIDRARLGDLVFNDPLARKRLNAIVHPLVRQWMADRTAEAVQRGAEVVIQEVPLLFESGLQDLFASVVLVDATEPAQLARLGERGMSVARANSIMASQMPNSEKRALADFVIDNNGTLEETRKQVLAVWEQIAK